MLARLTLISNVALMALFGLGSAFAQLTLRNNYLRYPNELDTPLPTISELALKIYPVVYLGPLVWAGITAWVLFRFRTPERLQGIVPLHTSVTLVLGLLMLFFFICSGIAPFLSLKVRLA